MLSTTCVLDIGWIGVDDRSVIFAVGWGGPYFSKIYFANLEF